MELDGPESTNVEDRRADGGPGAGGFGGGFGGFGYGGGFGGPGIPIPLGLFHGGFGIVAFIIIALILGFDPGALFSGASDNSGYPPTQTRTATRSTTNDPEVHFVARVLKSTEDVWGDYFQQMGRPYLAPHLVLFRRATNTACGLGQAATGPFYCPSDRRVYIDLSFFDELAQRFHAPGQFPQAYVIAHEVGHHVQNLLGISYKVERLTSQMSRRDANALSVRTELQADCLAGVWAHHAQTDQGRLKLTGADVEQAIAAATAIGDDRLQRQAQGRVMPDSFTHGTSDQRVRWLERGLESGDIKSCDTFRAQQL